MDGNHDEEKETRNEIVFAYILIGLSPLILLISVTNIVLLLWLVGLVFTAILIYRRHALPELQRNLMYLAVVIFILGLVFVEGSLMSMIGQEVMREKPLILLLQSYILAGNSPMILSFQTQPLPLEIMSNPRQTADFPGTS